MPNFKKPRKNKTKKEIVSDIQLVQDADRRRSLIKDLVFPYLVETKETIEYSKIFLQSIGGLVNTAFDEERKKTTIGSITPRLIERIGEIFNVREEKQKIEYDRYLHLIEKLKDISIQDFTYAVELSRYIDGYLLKSRGKDSIDTIPLDAIMGK
jgi:hypothetical protein